jgi:hypothetical protein
MYTNPLSKGGTLSGSGFGARLSCRKARRLFGLLRFCRQDTALSQQQIAEILNRIIDSLLSQFASPVRGMRLNA